MFHFQIDLRIMFTIKNVVQKWCHRRIVCSKALCLFFYFYSLEQKGSSYVKASLWNHSAKKIFYGTVKNLSFFKNVGIIKRKKSQGFILCSPSLGEPWTRNGGGKAQAERACPLCHQATLHGHLLHQRHGRSCAGVCPEWAPQQSRIPPESRDCLTRTDQSCRDHLAGKLLCQE